MFGGGFWGWGWGFGLVSGNNYFSGNNSGYNFPLYKRYYSLYIFENWHLNSFKRVLGSLECKIMANHNGINSFYKNIHIHMKSQIIIKILSFLLILGNKLVS